MRELTFVGPGQIEWREKPDPRVAASAEAVVRPIAATTCDLDRALIAGKAPIPGPFALGHECVAEVADVGDGVREVAVGDVVVVPWSLHCGTCRNCQRGLTASCLSVAPRAMYGTPLGGHFGGLFSDLVHVPFADAMLVKVPAGVAPETVASASDNLTDAWVAVSRSLAERPGARVLVVGGSGCIGYFAIELAIAAGASGVDYTDHEGRLALARELGARVFTRADALPEKYDVVVDASAHPEQLSRAMKALGPGGICASTGIYFFDTPMPLLDMYAEDVTFRIGRCSVGPHIARVLGLVAEGKVHPERVHSDVLPWETMIETLLARKAKPILTRPPIHARA
jgi:alcohol dehydrogenase